MTALIAVHVAATLALVGLIWFVQIVHYPMLRPGGLRGANSFGRMHAEHTSRTGLVAAPLMIVELATAVFLVVFGERDVLGLARVGLALVGVTWVSTFLVQVPLHRVLARGWDREAHRRLVRTNWIRTASWTTRSFVVLLLALGTVGAAAPASPDRDAIVDPHHGLELTPPATQEAQPDGQIPPIRYRT